MAYPLPHPRSPLEDEDVAPWCAFDVLELPADAGYAVLRRLPVTGPVALVRERRMQFLVGAGSADELPGLLDWLEWGSVLLDLTALGTGGRITAPVPPSWPGSRGAAVWLRPPEPGYEVEPTLPAFRGFAGVTAGKERGGAPDLVRLVDTAATECHRARLLRGAVAAHRADHVGRTKSQPLACS
ncbi:SCO3374 family protein [Streptomyces sp. NPDC050738]|uniref:SCO3374 family protein n=1 Tax=Streptomyces sp. NPDC050738 TaxID=3154744 RepID=UPI003427E9FE